MRNRNNKYTGSNSESKQSNDSTLERSKCGEIHQRQIFGDTGLELEENLQPGANFQCILTKRRLQISIQSSTPSFENPTYLRSSITDLFVTILRGQRMKRVETG